LEKRKIPCPGHFGEEENLLPWTFAEEENLLPMPEMESWIIEPVVQLLYQLFYPGPVIS
jgi:hypothetical protein